MQAWAALSEDLGIHSIQAKPSRSDGDGGNVDVTTVGLRSGDDSV
jgi:hypothetical protein